MTSKLNEKQTNILRLIKRSKPDNDGWYSVSDTVWKLVNGTLPNDIIITEKLEKGYRLRLTEKGLAVLEYLF